MILSKSWLHRTIIQACDAYAEGEQTTERVEAIADAYTHAIAGKLAEGVVIDVRDEGFVYGEESWNRNLHIVEGGGIPEGKLEIEIHGVTDTLRQELYEDGGWYRVTVTKEE